MDEELRNLVAMDLLGYFPITSTSGYKYIFIMYNWDASYIKPLLMKLRKTDKMLRCCSECYNFFKKAVFNARFL